MTTFYRYDGNVRVPFGSSIPGANVAVCSQPANFSTQPASPLVSIYAASASNAATITAASWNGGQIMFTFSTTPPSDVIVGSYIGVSGVSPSTYNTTLIAPWLVLEVSGNNVFVAAPNNPGTYVSGGTVATSVLPNPTFTDSNGNFFFYAVAGLYSIQIYGPTIVERDLEDQGIGTVAGGSVTSVAMTGDGTIFNSTVTGSPITTNGTLIQVLLVQAANTFLAGPTSGGATFPGWRKLVATDLPSGTGTVTNVGLSLSVPSSVFSGTVTGSPITTTGTIAQSIVFVNQSANTFLRGPTSGAAAAPSFGALVVNDFNSGTGASSSTFWRGDGTWATPSGSGLNFMNGIVPTGSYPGTSFTIPHTPSGIFTLLTKNGQVLTPSVDYSISGTTITYTVTVINTDRILIWATY